MICAFMGPPSGADASRALRFSQAVSAPHSTATPPKNGPVMTAAKNAPPPPPRVLATAAVTNVQNIAKSNAGQLWLTTSEFMGCLNE